MYEVIQLYLHMDIFSMGHANGSLVTNAANSAASCIWEYQLHLAVKDGSLCVLFDNKGDMFNGKGFEMLAALNHHCCTETVSTAFSSLMSLFNKIQGESESILAYRSRFNGLVNNLSWSKVSIPLVLIIMLFRHCIHGHYSEILDQFWTRHMLLETTNINLVIKNVKYLNSFTLHDPKGKAKSSARVPAAATANTDKNGKVWQSPFDWLSQAYGKKGITVCWKWALTGNGICPICQKSATPHLPPACPLLKDLNLTLIQGPASSSGNSLTALSSSPGGAPAVA